MQKVVAAVALLLVAGLPIPTASATHENVIRNPGFETQTFGSRLAPDDWDVLFLTGFATQSTAQKHSGQASLAMTGHDAGSGLNLEVRSVPAALETCQVTVEVWTFVASGGLRIGFDLLDAEGRVVQQATLATNPFSPGRVWFPLSTTITLDPEVRAVQVVLTSTVRDFALFVDDVRVTPEDDCPVPCFDLTIDVLNVEADASCSVAAAGRTIVKQLWAWGDGSQSSGLRASHFYQDGTYDVTLEVQDSAGLSARRRQTVAVHDLPPLACFVDTVTGLHVVVDASCSSDPDDVVAAYEWSWGDGTTSTGPHAEHTYAGDGTYAVNLTVRDGYAASSWLMRRVAVANRPPWACFTTTMQGLLVTFDTACTLDDQGDLFFYFDWGDGSGKVGRDRVFQHHYGREGEFAVRLTVMDPHGAISKVTGSVSVVKGPPVPCFWIEPRRLTARVGADCSFADHGAVSYDWDWGDGTHSSEFPRTSHDYAGYGEYPITLTITDALGNVRTLTHIVTVIPPALEESWESGLEGWGVIGLGASTDCGVSIEGDCSLRLEPPCCAPVILTKEVDADLDRKHWVDLRFQGSSAKDRARDTKIVLRTDTGRVEVQLTYDCTTNTGQEYWNSCLRILTEDEEGQRITIWTTPHDWYRVVIVLDHGTGHVELSDEHGFGDSAGGVSVPGTRLTSIEITTMRWTTDPAAVYWMDALSID